MTILDADLEPFARLADAIGSGAFLPDLGRLVRASVGADAFAIHQLDERRKSAVMLSHGFADDRIAALYRQLPHLQAPSEVSRQSAEDDPWESTEPALALGGDSEPAPVLHALLERKDSVAVVLSLTRLLRDRVGPGVDRQRLRRVMPLLRSLWCAHNRATSLAAERNALFEALSHRRLGAITLDEVANVISANRSAAELMTETAALKLSHHGLLTGDPVQMRALQTALGEIFSELREGGRARSRTLTLSSATTRRSLKLWLHPIPVGMPRAGMRTPVIVVLLSDPQADLRPGVRETARVFGLTVVETELVCCLAEGRSVDDAAVTLRVSSHTARKYLQQVFAKTGTGRQADLLMLMISGAAPGQPQGPRTAARRLMSKDGLFATKQGSPETPMRPREEPLSQGQVPSIGSAPRMDEK